MRSGPGILVVGAVLLLATSCTSQAVRTRPLRLSPEQAVMNAAEMPNGVSGVFEMVVRATGRQDGLLYLNSQPDYRDPRNLTIVVSPSVEKALEKRFGAPVESFLLRNVVAIRGTARKTRINFIQDGLSTGKYYFQTHLVLRSDRELTVEGERPIV